MRTSTRLLLGSTMIKWLRGTRNNGNGQGCALGMIEASGGSCAHLDHFDVELPCDCNLANAIMGSSCHYSHYLRVCQASSAIVHLFNYHVMTTKDWTLERLVDWLRSVEPADPEEDTNAADPQTVSERDEVLSLR